MKAIKRLAALLMSLVILLGVLPTVSVSAEAVVPRAVQLQWLAEWKDDYYGGGNLYDTGCGIFSIVNAVGYVTGNEMSVTEVAAWAHSIGAFNSGNSSEGTRRLELYPELEAKYGAEYGFTCDTNGGNGWWAGASSSVLKNHLLSGGVAIGHVLGHFIAVVGYDSSTGYFHIYDSAPSTARGTGNGDAWVSESWLSTSSKLTLDWFCLVTGTGHPINRDYGETGGTTASKLGTYRLNANAPAADPLNVRAGAGTSYEILTTVQEGDIVDVTELSGDWGKFVAPDGVEGWASIAYYSDYIGVDALAYNAASTTEGLTGTYNADGSLTLTNTASSQGQFDLILPFKIGTATTPYMSLQIEPLSGSGYYFGVTQFGSGYWMMRDCMSGDELVVEDTAPYMTNTETLEINVYDWWVPSENYQIDQVRVYVAPNSSIRIHYFYFAASAGVVVDTTYNLMKGSVPNMNLMLPETLSIADSSKAGGYTYNNGVLTVTADTASGYDVVFQVNETFDVYALKRLLVSVNSNVPFNITLTVTNKNGEGNVSLVSDFYPSFQEPEYPASGYISAWQGTAYLDMYNYYACNGVVPADGLSTVKKVTVSLGAAGTATFSAIQLAATDTLQSFADGVVKSDSSAGVDNVVFESQTYTVDSTIVSDVDAGTVADFLANVTSDYTVTVYQNDTVLDNSSTLKTGQVVKVLDGSTVLCSYTIAVYGDVNGDGVASTADAREILVAVARNASFTGAKLEAADLNGSGDAESSDARSLLLMVL